MDISIIIANQYYEILNYMLVYLLKWLYKRGNFTISMNTKRTSLNIFVITSIAIGLYFSFGTLLVSPIDKVFGQSTSSSSTTSSILVSKELTNSYTISSGSSKIAFFETRYMILGNINSLNQEQKLIISTITTDFDNSPVVGYVKISSANNQQQSPTLANPFADKNTINQKIATEVSKALASTSTFNTAKASIDCHFGSSISQWTCKSQKLVG
jgi:hypothetical protein